MIVHKISKGAITNDNKPNENWAGEDYYLVDETTLEGKALAKKIQDNGTHFDFVLNADGKLIDVTPSKPLNVVKEEKLTELYDAYQSEKWSEITSSVLGSDGLAVVFEYAKENKDDYQAIATAFALDPNKTESIIGSKSHGKFYISRANMITFAGDMDNHETNLYLKFKDKEALVLGSTTETEVKAISW